MTTSKPSTVLLGVPQGSVLGPILFVLYNADVLQLVKDHRLLPHAYADDTQILGVCRPSETDELQHRVSDCLDAVSSWMAANRLQLNHEKTEALWCSSARRQHHIPTTPVTAARNLGILSRWRRQHAHSRDYKFYNCSAVFCHATSDTERSPFSATSSHADHASVPCH